MATINYRQCTFRTPVEHADGSGVYTESTAWLPEKVAVVGKHIYFGQKTSDPEKMWKVMTVSSHSQPESYVKAHERDYKTQREASDI